MATIRKWQCSVAASRTYLGGFREFETCSIWVGKTHEILIQSCLGRYFSAARWGLSSPRWYTNLIFSAQSHGISGDHSGVSRHTSPPFLGKRPNQVDDTMVANKRV